MDIMHAFLSSRQVVKMIVLGGGGSGASFGGVTAVCRLCWSKVAPPVRPRPCQMKMRQQTGGRPDIMHSPKLSHFSLTWLESETTLNLSKALPLVG